MTTSTFKLLGSIFLVISLFIKGFSTTIIPFHNLGEMTNASTIVVLATAGAKAEVQVSGVTHFQTPLTVQFVVKGNVGIGTDLFLKHWSSKGKGWVREVPDDVKLIPNETYLLFLAYSGDGGLRPMLMSYGIFQQYGSPSGQYFLAPLQESYSLSMLSPSDGLPIEPLAVYRQDDLLHQLHDLVHHNSHWDGNKSIETLDVAAFVGTTIERAPPSHCTFFNLRWLGFPTTPVTVLYSSAGDASCSPDPTIANTYVVAAAGLMQASYSGINLVDGGTFSGFTPDCMGGSAADGNFTSFFGERNLVVQYNDPCSEIPDLSGCSGTLAIGGLYGFSPTYTYDGNTYFEGAYGYVVVNNGTCCVGPASYTLTMTHEMTHSLGVDHIPASAGPANMNPSCCSPITVLDIACLDYFYPLAFPVELADFRGVATPDAIRLEWSTASELNNLNFEVERSDNGHDFETIATINGTGISSSPHSYSSIDKAPLHGLNYYRLRQTDTDGIYRYSNAIAVHFSAGSQYFAAVPNPISGANLRLLVENEESTPGEIFLINTHGMTLLRQQIEVGAGRTNMEIDLPALPAGQYLVKLLMNGSIRQARFTKN